MFDEVVTISDNRKINPSYWKLTFASEKLAKKVQPGQFLNIQLEDDSDPFLRRPFSYYRTSGKKIEVLYEILGRGTKLLTAKRKGDTLKVLGPLGKPFTQKQKDKIHILVGGGVGVPPLVFLAERSPVDYLLIGCKTRGQVLPKSELSKVKAKILYSTDDGSYGAKGFVTVILRELIKKEKNSENLFIQTCGPHAMMEAVMKLAKEYKIEGEASIDEQMACGVGACLGCMVLTKDGYKTSCTDGPIFRFSELVH